MNIVVGVKYNGQIFWTYSDEELWFLNLKKIDSTVFGKYALSVRKDYPVLDRFNVLTFLGEHQDFIVSAEQLKLKLDSKTENFYPALILDFDKKVVYDNFPEPNNYSLALNEGWNYSYEDIDNIVDEKERYWGNF